MVCVVDDSFCVCVSKLLLFVVFGFVCCFPVRVCVVVLFVFVKCCGRLFRLVCFVFRVVFMCVMCVYVCLCFVCCVVLICVLVLFLLFSVVSVCRVCLLMLF